MINKYTIVRPLHNLLGPSGSVNSTDQTKRRKKKEKKILYGTSMALIAFAINEDQ